MKAKPISPSSVRSGSEPEETPAKAKPSGTPPVKSIVKTTKKRSPYVAPQFEHPRLAHTYPIIEIATLAASFGSEHFDDRLDSAIDMLAMIEQMEVLPMETKIRNESRKRRGPAVDDLPPAEIEAIGVRYRYRQQFPKKCIEILKNCERGGKFHRVKRASLIAEVCKDVKGADSTTYDPELFNEWLDSLMRHSNGDPRTNGTHGFRYESARRVQFIQDDDAAFHLIRGFHQWLTKRSKGAKPLRSEQTGTFVSNSTKGTVLDEGKKFRTK